MQASQPKPPREVTVGYAIELVGIALAIFGLTVPYSQGGASVVYGSPVISGIGVLVALIGLAMHIARI